MIVVCQYDNNANEFLTKELRTHNEYPEAAKYRSESEARRAIFQFQTFNKIVANHVVSYTCYENFGLDNERRVFTK